MTPAALIAGWVIGSLGGLVIFARLITRAPLLPEPTVEERAEFALDRAALNQEMCALPLEVDDLTDTTRDFMVDLQLWLADPDRETA